MTAPVLSAAEPTSTTLDQVVWYRHPNDDRDHAFGTTSGYLRSRCGDVRWSVLLALVEGTVRACPRCLAAVERPVAPETPLEERAANGDR